MLRERAVCTKIKHDETNTRVWSDERNGSEAKTEVKSEAKSEAKSEDKPEAKSKAR